MHTLLKPQKTQNTLTELHKIYKKTPLHNQMTKKPIPIISPTYKEISGEDPHKGTLQLERWKNYPKQDIIKRYPLQLDLETTSACNLRCPMCFQSETETRPEVQNMSFELYSHIITEGAAKGLDSIKLQYRGEPLLTTDLPERVRFATERGIQVRFNTNGTLLTKQLAENLIDAGLYQIIFSIDSHIPEEYNKIRRLAKTGKGDFNSVLKNFRQLVELRNERGTTYPQIRVTRVDLPETRTNLPKFSNFWMENGADLVSVVELSDFSMGTTDTKMIVSPEFSCEQPWQRLIVLADGQVGPCCRDHYQELTLAQISTPEQIASYSSMLTKKAGKKQVGDLVEVDILDKPKLKKVVIGTKERDGSVTPHSVKIKGITESISTVPLVSNIEEVWNGKTIEWLREMNRTGNTHLVQICLNCDLRRTTIEKNKLESRLEDIPESIKSKAMHATKYTKGGLGDSQS